YALHHVTTGAAIERELDLLGLREHRDHHDLDVRIARTNTCQALKAAKLRHANVQQDDVRSAPPDQRQDLGPRASRAHDLKTAIRYKYVVYSHQHERMVVRQQDLHRPLPSVRRVVHARDCNLGGGNGPLPRRRSGPGSTTNLTSRSGVPT